VGPVRTWPTGRPRSRHAVVVLDMAAGRARPGRALHGLRLRSARLRRIRQAPGTGRLAGRARETTGRPARLLGPRASGRRRSRHRRGRGPARAPAARPPRPDPSITTSRPRSSPPGWGRTASRPSISRSPRATSATPTRSSRCTARSPLQRSSSGAKPTSGSRGARSRARAAHTGRAPGGPARQRPPRAGGRARRGRSPARRAPRVGNRLETLAVRRQGEVGRSPGKAFSCPRIDHEAEENGR
jgi:hypothetical protein